MLRRFIFGLSFALAITSLSAPLCAQMHHVSRPGRVTRAIGVYEWTGDLKKPDAERLIPVSIFIDGHFEDGGVYLAHPVPLALETGNVYAVQRSGDPIGTFDLDYARNIVDRRDVADDNPIGAWYGYGRFLSLAATPVAKLPPSSHPSVIVSSLNDDDSRPHFVNRTPGEAGNPSAPASTTPSSTSSSPAPPDDPDRPVLHRSPDSESSESTASTDNAPASPGTASTEDDPERPTLGHRDEKETEKQEKQDQKRHKHDRDGGAVIPLSTSLNDDPNRPMLQHGKVESATAPPQLTGVPANLHQAIAVSDAANRPTHVFSRDWDSLNEKSDTRTAMQKMAQPLVQEYMTANHLQPGASSGPKLVTSPKSKSSKARAIHRKPTAPPPLSFQDEQLTGFTLSYGGLPTFVYSASVPAAGADISGPLVRVTVVAQRLPSGELQTSLTSVTDDKHLDRTPWMRLVDAVDADASHRASLLFELRAKNSRQFALYSLVSAHAQQTFVTGIIE